MKSLLLALIAASLAGCASVPKDTYIRGGKLVINTPWGPSTLEGEVIATGKAAIEAARDVETETTVPQTVAEKLAAKSKK